MKLISTRRRFLRLAAAVSAAGLPLIGRAQNAPLRMVVAWPAGGISDSVARLLAERMAPILYASKAQLRTLQRRIKAWRADKAKDPILGKLRKVRTEGTET